MDIKELKIVYDWAESEMLRKKDQQFTDPENYDEIVRTRNLIKKTFDYECERWVRIHITKK